jgi:TolB-like protein
MPDSRLLERLRKRKLVQWAIAYLSAAFVLFQGMEALADPWNVPKGITRAVHVVLAVGVVVTLVLAWYHGEKGRQRVSGTELIVIAVLLLAGGGVLALTVPERPVPDLASPHVARPSDPRPSLAVLPFVNISPSADDAYLADGLHEEVLAQLTRIAGLRVVSRTSVLAYRDSEKNCRDIAAELGVDALVEGSVRRAGTGLRVTVQLIDGRTDEHLWTDAYDRPFSLDGLLSMQAEIATQIAHALRTQLSREEQASLGSARSGNLEAYQAYLRARYFLQLPHYTPQYHQRALDELERAVQLDPGFALAWAELAQTHAQEVFYWTDATEERRDRARHAARSALAAGPPAPEVALLLGLYHLWLDRDVRTAGRQIEAAAAELPNSRRVHVARAHLNEIAGRMDEAVRNYEEALHLSPRDPSLLSDLALAHWWARDYPQAIARAEEAIVLAPDELWARLAKVFATWSQRGPTAELDETLAPLPLDESWVLWSRYWQAALDDRFAEALDLVAGTNGSSTKMWFTPRPLYEAWALEAMGQHEAARARYEEARRLLEARVEARPEDPRYRSALGLALAGLGDRRAVAAGEAAIRRLPMSRDAVYGIPYVQDLAAIHARLGDDAAALDRLRTLFLRDTWVSPAFVEHDPRFDRLTRTPAYASLRDEYERRSPRRAGG